MSSSSSSGSDSSSSHLGVILGAVLGSVFGIVAVVFVSDPVHLILGVSELVSNDSRWIGDVGIDLDDEI